MLNSFRNVAMLLAFLTIAGSNLFFDFINSYVACGLALVAAFLARLAMEWVFIERAYREMMRLHGADWQTTAGKRVQSAAAAAKASDSRK
ncbi:hypothetical protein [Bradyrhizobium neotropicale]|uniref:Uncharacterized protein n=1 Tax=Bradyrhizobium neotropicale TaxID=1497615 RepID=A0A176Z9U4_9BRAD|nr:hypothetical protein [Bradyrhizobium neotropicale]OAF16924.1 hypothetical protein AXW67_00170 [Bradyrhizobium neotropicale]